MLLSSAVIGMDEMTCDASYRLPPAVTATARPPEWWTAVTGVSMTTADPWPSTSVRHRSHIIPGPCLGYWNSSMRLVMSFWFRLGSTALRTALDSDRFLIRWAAQSDLISVAGTPQTFSV